MPVSKSVSTPSPLTTREQRDRLLRKPLRKSMNPYNNGESYSITNSYQHRDNRPIIGQCESPSFDKTVPISPPTSKFATSSPATFYNSPDTPGVSVINPDISVADTTQSYRRKNTPKSTRSNSNSRTSKMKYSSSSTVKLDESNSVINDEDTKKEDNETPAKTKKVSFQKRTLSSTSFESEDDIQPSATVVKLNKKTTEDESSSNNVMNSVILFSAIAIPIILGFGAFTSYQKSQQTYTDLVPNFKTEFKNLQLNYPNQSEKTWQIIFASLKKIFEEKTPTQPSVLLIASKKNGHSTVNCLAKEIASMTERIFSGEQKKTVQTFYGRDFISKEDLFTILQSVLENSHSFLMYNIEKISGLTAQALHPFCDNINAPFKRTTIILTTTIDDDLVIDDATTSSVVDKSLTNRWLITSDEDKIWPVISRISVSTTFIQPEEDPDSLC